ncbi:MAG: hypothetical protein AAFY60_12420, partial [Myxococcota bacterium]
MHYHDANHPTTSCAQETVEEVVKTKKRRIGRAWEASVIRGGESASPVPLDDELTPPVGDMDAVRREVENYLAACYQDAAANKKPARPGDTRDSSFVAADREIRDGRTPEVVSDAHVPTPPNDDREEQVDRGPTALTTVGPRALIERPKHPLEELLDAQTVDQVLGTINRAGKWLSLFRAHWKKIVVMTLLGGLLGTLSFWVTPPAARVEFAMVLKSAPTDNPVLGDKRTDVEFFRSTPQNFTGLSLIANTLEKLGVEAPSEVQVQGVRDNLLLRSVGPNSYRGSYETHNPDEALTFMKAHVDNYLDTEVEKTLSSIRAEAEFLQGQLASTQKELRRTEEDLIDFKRDNARGTPDAAQGSYTRLVEVMRAENAVRGQIASAQLQLELDQAKLDREDPLVESRRLATRPYAAKIIELEQQLALARARGLGEKHPDVVALVMQIDELEALAERSVGQDTEVERSRNTTYEQISDQIHAARVKLELARKRLDSLVAEKSKLQKVVGQLPELEAEHTELTRSYHEDLGSPDKTG